MIKILIINLERSKNRRDKINRNLKDLGIKNYEFVKAIDYKKLPDSFFKSIIDKEKQHWNRDLSKSEIATALSHRKIYRKILNDNLKQNYLILEDDAILYNNILKIINSDFNIPNKVDLIRLGVGSDYNYITYTNKKDRLYKDTIKFLKHNKDALICKTNNECIKWNALSVYYNKLINISGFDFYKVNNKKTRIYCASGYIINKKSIKKILKHKYILNTADDIFTSLNLNSYILQDFMTYPDLYIKSTIEHSELY